MDLKITITDENGEVRAKAAVHQDGSDSEGANRMIELIATDFIIERPALDWDDPMVTFQSLCAQALHCIETPGDFTANEQERLELNLTDAISRQL